MAKSGLRRKVVSEEQLARSFYIALRAHKVPDAAAMHMTRRAIDQYKTHKGRGKLKLALDALSATRAESMAEALKSDGV